MNVNIREVPVPAYVLDGERALVEANAGFASLLGVEADTLIGLSHARVAQETDSVRRVLVEGGAGVTIAFEADDKTTLARIVGVHREGEGHARRTTVFVAPDKAGDAESSRRFGEILLDLSRGHEIDAGVLSTSFGAITEAAASGLGVSRSSIWLYGESDTLIRCEDLFESSTKAHTSGAVLMAADFPSYFSALADDRTIAAEDARSHPATREFTEAYLVPLGITSMLEAPIRRAGRLIGVLCSEHVGPARSFSSEDRVFSASLADFVARALDAADRRAAEAAVAKAQRELELQNQDLEQLVELRTRLLSEKDAENQDLIRRLRGALEELSTPVLELWDDVLALPVVGVLDSQRSAEMTERLLAETARSQARVVIVDLTGVEVVDTATADRLLKLAQAVEMLGARCLVTGIQPAVAQTIVELGVEFGRLRTLRNLKHALKVSMKIAAERGAE